MSTIPSLERAALTDLLSAVLGGLPITIRAGRVRPGKAWGIDPRDPSRPILYISCDAPVSDVAAALPGAFATLRELADRRGVRPALRAVPGAAESLSAPVRPTLRVLPGGAR